MATDSMAGLAIVGGGRMGEALAAGLLRSRELDPEGLIVVEPDEGRRQAVAESLGGQVTVVPSIRPAAGYILAVKPQVVEAVCAQLTAGVRCLSIAAGITLARLESWLSPGTPVIRAMPNTPALVGRSASAMSLGRSAGEPDERWAARILSSVGTVDTVPEALLDAVTGLSGSGPAYIMLVAEAMAEAGVLCGLPRPVAERLTMQTLAGSAELLVNSGRRAEQLRVDVTSPGGTTAAGLAELERGAVRSAFLQAVRAAAARSAELGKI